MINIAIAAIITTVIIIIISISFSVLSTLRAIVFINWFYIIVDNKYFKIINMTWERLK